MAEYLLASEGKFLPQNQNLTVYGTVIFSYNPIWYKQKNLTPAKLQLKLDQDKYFKWLAKHSVYILLHFFLIKRNRNR